MIGAALGRCALDRVVDAMFGGWAAGETATIIAAVLGALVAVGVGVLAYVSQQKASRREQRLTAYAEALRAVADYREAPYLIRRRDDSSETRTAITTHISDIQSRISFYEAWLALHTTPRTHQRYTEYVSAARKEAGVQMTAAWQAPPTTRDADVPLGVAYDQPDSDKARAALLTAMTADR